MEIKDNIFMNIGGDRRLGTGFIIAKEIKGAFIEFEPILERICRMRRKWQKILIINIHEPTEEAPVEIKGRIL